MIRPSNCNSCPFFRSCTSGMYMNGCGFYAPKEKHKNFAEKLKHIFHKAF